VPPNELGLPDILEVPKGVPTSLPGFSNTHLTPELTKIIDAWPLLPPVAKAGILAMIEATKGAQVDDNGRQ
jgi:hypothetical protein